MHLFVNNMADPDISDYEFDTDDLLLMPSWKRENPTCHMYNNTQK